MTKNTKQTYPKRNVKPIVSGETRGNNEVKSGNNVSGDTVVASASSAADPVVVGNIKDLHNIQGAIEANNENVFGWPALQSFPELSAERARFQVKKQPLDKDNSLDVKQMMGIVVETSKAEDRNIAKEKRLDDKRLHQTTGGRAQVNNQDSQGSNQGRLSQGVTSNSTEQSDKEGENQDSIASAHNGEEPKLSRRARAKANRIHDQNDEQVSFQDAELGEVNGKTSKLVKDAVPLMNPNDSLGVESKLQLAKSGNSELNNANGANPSSGENKFGEVKAIVSNTPASEGKGSLEFFNKQNGTAKREGVQSLSLSKNKEDNVIKNASKGFVVMFSEKTDEIISPLNFMASNYTKMSMALFQLLVPAILTYLITTHVSFVSSGINQSQLLFQIILYIIFYVGCLCASIVAQVLISGLKGMFIKAFRDAAALGEKR